MRNAKGQYTSPEEKQISSGMEEFLGLYLDSLKEQKSSRRSQHCVHTARTSTAERSGAVTVASCADRRTGPVEPPATASRCTHTRPVNPAPTHCKTTYSHPPTWDVSPICNRLSRN